MAVANQLPPGTEVVSPRFKLVFVAVLVLTVLCALASILCAVNDQTKELSPDFMGMFKVGSGAVFGLLGGKAL